MEYKISLKKGENCKICTCGKSKIMPLCDESHRELNEKNNTNYKSLKITPEENINLILTSNAWEN
ncbi:MAG: CDGSH iron-sulfur domain-containing protein [Nanoarchaeota archaeon]